MNKVILIILILIQKSFAQNIRVESNEAEILLKGSCEVIEKNLATLSKWAKDSKRECEQIVNSNSCGEAKVTNCLPPHIVKYHNISPDASNPNCWNLALVFSGLIPSLRHSSAEEMAFYMDAPFCSKISDLEPKKPGDVGAIRWNDEEKAEIHGFIYISDDLAYSKNGFDKKEPFQLKPLSEVFSNYGYGSGPNDRTLEYFRCKSLDEYLKENKTEIKDQVRNILDITTKIDCHISDFNMDANAISSSTIELASSMLKILAQWLKEELRGIESLSTQDKKILVLVKTRLDAISGNINEDINDVTKNKKDWKSLVSLRNMINKSVDKLQKKL